MKTAVVLALAGAAMSAPTRTIENRQLSGLGSGSGTDSGLNALKSFIPGLPGGLPSGLPSLPHFGGLPGSGGSSSGLPSLPHFGGLPSLGDSGVLPSVPTGLPSLSGLEGSSSEGEASKTEKRQFGDLSSLESLIPSITSGGGLDALESLIPSGGLGSLLGGSSTGSGGLSALESLIPSSGSGGLSSLLGGSSTSGGLSALESLIPSAGSSGLGLKARHQATETDKRQFGDLSSLESLIPGLGDSSSTGSGLSALESLIPSSGSGGLSSLLGGSSTSGGLSALESLIPSAGSSELGFKARRDASEIKKRQFSLSGSTENGVTSNTGCKELTFIFARGTGELGNMGTVVGPEVAAQLKTLTSDKVTIQGVTYPADAAGNADLGASGGPAMAKLVKQALSQCPKTKVVLGGYSQGAMVVHNAARSLSSGQISGAVLFGDPFKSQAVPNLSNDKRKEFCAMGDPVCENGFNVMAHLTYGSDAKTAAQFLVSAAGLS